MRIARKPDQKFEPLGVPGLSKVDLWGGRHDVSFQLLHAEKGRAYPEQFHDAWEIMFVTKGKIRVGNTVFEAGDFLFTEPGESHDSEVLEDTTILIGNGKG